MGRVCGKFESANSGFPSTAQGRFLTGLFPPGSE